MLDGLRHFFTSPYLAPVTEPVRNVARITAMPLRDFVAALADSWEGEYTSWPARFVSRLTDQDSMVAGLMTFGGAIVGGVGGLMGGIAVSAGLSTSGMGAVAAGAGLASAGAALGVVAGPFVVAAAVGIGAFTVGCALGIVPGVIAGTAKMIKHIFSKKDAPEMSAPANDDAVAAETPTVRTVLRGPRTASEMMQSFSTLQSEERKAFEAIMMDHLRPAFEAAAAVALSKDTTPAFDNKGAAFGKIGKLVV